MSFYHVNRAAVDIIWWNSEWKLTSYFSSLQVDLKYKFPHLCVSDHVWASLAKNSYFLFLTWTTDEFFSALAISLVSVVSFFIRLKLVSTDRSTSAKKRTKGFTSFSALNWKHRRFGSYTRCQTRRWASSEIGPCEGWRLRTRTPPAFLCRRATVWRGTFSFFPSPCPFRYVWQDRLLPSLSSSSWTWDFLCSEKVKRVIISKQGVW